MKKILLMMVLACSTLLAHAQLDNGLSVKGGIGISSIVGSDADNFKSSFTYKVGISYDWALTYDEFERPKFFIIPGINYSSQSFKIDGIEGNIRTNYVEVPILAAYKHAFNDKLSLVGKVGPYFSYGLFGTGIEIYSYGYDDDFGYFYDNESYNIFDSERGFDRFDAGLVIGASLEYTRFSAGLEFQRGFVKRDSDYKQFNQGFWLTICCKL